MRRRMIVVTLIVWLGVIISLNSTLFAAVIGIDTRSHLNHPDNLWTGAALDTFRSRISGLGHTLVSITSFRNAQLEGLDALILLNPYRTTERWSNAELADIRNAVVHRMNLVIIGEVASNVGVGGDQTESDQVLQRLNALAGTYGVQYARFIDNGRLVNGFARHVLTDFLSIGGNPGITVYRYRKMIQIHSPALNLTTGSGEADNVLAVVDATPCGGSVVFLSDLSTWWDSDYLLNVGLGEQNNSKLLDNVINFIAQPVASFEDCNGNDLPDHCDLTAGRSPDCNGNSLPDECDIAMETSDDFNNNDIPDECDPDCQPNGFPDFLDIALGQSEDCNQNEIPDECEPGDFDLDGVIDICDDDIDDDGIPNKDDECKFTYLGTAVDLHGRSYGDLDLNCTTDLHDWRLLIQGLTGPLPDVNEVRSYAVTSIDTLEFTNSNILISGILDCNDNGVPDDEDILNGTSNDFNGNDIPDECEPDCQPNGIPDFIEISVGNSEDCNDDEIPDECQPDDFDADGVIDLCDADADADGIADEADECLFTPIGTAVDTQGRPQGDINMNCSTDLKDYSLFQIGFSGTPQ